MELYTYLHMGGSVERVELMDIEGKTPEQLQHTLASFDAHKASCFKPNDKQRLLGVIEAGYGDLHAFNMEVRWLLQPEAARGRITRGATMSGRLTRSATSRALGRTLGLGAPASGSAEAVPAEEAPPPAAQQGEGGRIFAAKGMKRAESAHI